jgi:hypothetical protein
MAMLLVANAGSRKRKQPGWLFEFKSGGDKFLP